MSDKLFAIGNAQIRRLFDSYPNYQCAGWVVVEQEALDDNGRYLLQHLHHPLHLHVHQHEWLD